MKGRVAFLDAVHPVLHERLEKAGWVCDHMEELGRQEILEGALKAHSGVVIRARLQLDEALFRSLPALQFVARSGAGLENIAVDYANAHGIQVFNSPEGNADAVGEHALGQLLMLFHKLRIADASVRNNQWEREAHRGVELKGKTVAIIGFGNMGRSFARKLRGMECRVVAYDKYVQGYHGDEGVLEWTMDQVFEQADVVSLHLPFNEETNQLAQQDWLSAFKRPITLINTARGGIVNTADVLDAIDAQEIHGAALDVLEFECRSLEGLTSRSSELDRLLANDRVVLSPHVAGWSVESYFKLSDVLADKIQDWQHALPST
ncbi:MAG TPA: phosphoglycerate dehydrogenase [Flavobacteriales bacterium]|nr:phosphoglycerate dehydrogenase [Flavobacteriales bacterium]